MKVIGIKLINEIELPIVVECNSLEVSGYDLDGDEDFDPNNCSVYMHGSHPSMNYFIIKTERYRGGRLKVKPYKWLTKEEAEAIVKCAAESDIIDLRKFGNYQICADDTIQTVFIRNDYNDWDDDDEPILVKIVDDTN